MAANRAYENDATPGGYYEGIPASHFSKRTQDGRPAEVEAPHEYGKLQRRSKCEPCGNISRRALIVGFLVAIVLINVAVGMAVWYIPRSTGRAIPDEATCSLCPTSSENNRTSTNPTKKVCEADWEYLGTTDYCYRAFADPLAFFHAERQCTSHEAHLASSRTPAEHIFVNGITDPKEYYWLGGTDIGKEVVWTWVDGEPIEPWQHWSKGQPDDSGNEDCFGIVSTNDGWHV